MIIVMNKPDGTEWEGKRKADVGAKEAIKRIIPYAHRDWTSIMIIITRKELDNEEPQ